MDYTHITLIFSFTFVELPKFTKALDQLETIEDQWYYFLKHADDSKDSEKILSHHPEIKAAYQILDRYHWSEEELRGYDQAALSVVDAKNAIKAAKEDGHKEGLQQGIEIGSQKMCIKLARTMLQTGLPLEQVIAMTELSEEDSKDLSKIYTPTT